MSPDHNDRIWGSIRVPRIRRRLRLVCFPYAGGGTGVFRDWENGLPLDVELIAVQLPGRGKRQGELAFSRLPSLAQVAAEGLLREGWLDGPFCLLGHSMGALVAFEVARSLRRRSGPHPQLLIAAGRGAPHLPDPGPALHAASDEAVVAELRRLGGTPPSLLEDGARREALLKIVRADFAVCETYAHSSEPPLNCPIAVFGGSQDADWPPPTLHAWSLHTTGSCNVHLLEGNHFFIESRRDAFLWEVSRQLAAALSDG
jgi:medium-chain acyl-[acyl-carrier-protein] hydrolase